MLNVFLRDNRVHNRRDPLQLNLSASAPLGVTRRLDPECAPMLVFHVPSFLALQYEQVLVNGHEMLI